MEGGGHESNELERLIRSMANENVPAGSQREQEAQLFVTPPLREVVHGAYESMMMLQQQQGQQQQQLVPPSFTDEFLNALAVPSPTAEWQNFISMTNSDLLQGPAYSSAAAAAAGASGFATTSSTGGFLTFQQLQRDLLSSDSAAAHDFANSAWGFVENQITPKIGNFPAGNNSEPFNLDAIQELLNTPMISGSNPHLTGSRTPQFLMSATHQASGDSDFYDYIRRASPPQTQFHSPSPPSAVGSVSPLQTSPSLSTHGGRRSPSPARLPNSAGSTRPNTPNSSVSSGSSSDGPEPPATAAGPSASTSKRKTPDRAMDEENEEIQSPELKKPSNKARKKGPKRVREPRYAIQTRSEIEIMEDGYKWRKYGQKAVKNSPNPRSYYRCTAPKCPVRKRVERSAEDPGLVITTYEGTHSHLSPAMNGSASRASNSDAPSLLVASGENRPGGAAYQPPASSFPFTSSVNPVPPARSNYDLTVQIQSGVQRDHEAATSSSLSSYAQDIQTAGASTAYNLQSLNNQESANSLRIRSHGSWHGSLQEFNPSMPDENLSNMLRNQQQQMHGTRNQMQEALQNTEGQMFRAVNFGAQGIGGEESSDDILTGLHIPFWASSGSEPRSTTRGMEEQLASGSAAATGDDSQLRDDQSPINDELLGEQIPIEGEVSQGMQEINLFTNLEASVAYLKEADDISLDMGEETNVAPTLAFSSTNINPMLVQWVQQAFNLITKSLKIVPLLKVHQPVEDGTSLHERLINVKQRLENASQKNPQGIIVATEIQPHQERIKFLFAYPQGMASTVGVGLDYAVVFWTRTNEILVEGIKEEEWLQLWTEAFTKGSSWHESIITYMLKCDAAGIVTTDFDCDQMLKDIDSDVTLSTIATRARQVCVLKLIGTFFMIARFLNYDVETHHDNSTEDSNLMCASTSTCLNLGENFEEEMRSNNCKLASNIIDESKWLVHPLQDLWSQILRIDHGRVGDDDSSSEDGKDNDGSEENNGGNNNRRSGVVGGLGGGGGGGENGNEGGGGHSNGGTSGGGGSSGGGAGGSSGGSSGGGSGGQSGGGGGSNGDGKGSNGGCGHGGPSGGDGDRSGGEGNGGVSGGGAEDGDVVKSPNFNSRNLIAQKAIVKVEPGPASGYWIMDRRNQTRIQDLKVLQDAHLQEVHIEPRMSFEFMIDTDGIKTIQTSISVNFDLEGAMPDASQTNRFGWFQREVIVSLKCSNVGDAKIGHGDRVVEEGKSQKNIFKENAQRTSGTNQYSIGGKASGGIQIVQLEGHGGFSKSTGTKASLQEHATEVPLKQIPGGFCPVRLTSGCSLSYKFFAPNYPTDITQVADERSRNAYMNSVIGSCATLCPKIMGSWYELREESDSYLYTFKAQRIVCELKSKRNVLGQIKSNRREFDQVYIVQIHVNHKMTHICKFKPRAFALKAGDNDACGELLRVGEIHE